MNEWMDSIHQIWCIYGNSEEEKMIIEFCILSVYFQANFNIHFCNVCSFPWPLAFDIGTPPPKNRSPYPQKNSATWTFYFWFGNCTTQQDNKEYNFRARRWESPLQGLCTQDPPLCCPPLTWAAHMSAKSPSNISVKKNTVLEGCQIYASWTSMKNWAGFRDFMLY